MSQQPYGQPGYQQGPPPQQQQYAPPPQQYAPPPQYAPQAPAAPAQDDVYEQLRKLGELKDKGILTEQEFAAKKSQLLGI
jgi:hypothetical protein